jgi:hypothetical protein
MMGTKLSVTARARRLLLRPLAITAMLVAGFAITASGASAAKTPGSWTVGPGKTLELEFMMLQAHDLDTAYFCLDGTCDVAHPLGSNAGHQDGTALTLPNFFYTNPDLTTTHIVTLDLHDATAGCDSFSTGSNAFASPLRNLPAHRSLSGLKELGDEIDINDGETHPNCAPPPVGPYGVSSNFNGNVVITRTP